MKSTCNFYKLDLLWALYVDLCSLYVQGRLDKSAIPAEPPFQKKTVKFWDDPLIAAETETVQPICKRFDLSIFFNYKQQNMRSHVIYEQIQTHELTNDSFYDKCSKGALSLRWAHGENTKLF